MCIGGNAGDGGAAERRKAEEERQARIRQGNKSIDSAFSGFDDNFYNKRRDSYLEFATPQATDQYQDAFQKLTLALADSNLLNSSAAARRRGRLLKTKGEIERKIGSKANEYANTARSQIGKAKTDLQSQNMNIANPTLVAANAAQRAQALNEVPTFDPLINLFANASEGLATQADLERRSKARYPNVLFESKGSGKVVS